MSYLGLGPAKHGLELATPAGFRHGDRARASLFTLNSGSEIETVEFTGLDRLWFLGAESDIPRLRLSLYTKESERWTRAFNRLPLAPEGFGVAPFLDRVENFTDDLLFTRRRDVVIGPSIRIPHAKFPRYLENVFDDSGGIPEAHQVSMGTQVDIIGTFESKVSCFDLFVQICPSKFLLFFRKP